MEILKSQPPPYFEKYIVYLLYKANVYLLHKPNICYMLYLYICSTRQIFALWGKYICYMLYLYVCSIRQIYLLYLLYVKPQCGNYCPFAPRRWATSCLPARHALHTTPTLGKTKKTENCYPFAPRRWATSCLPARHRRHTTPHQEVALYTINIANIFAL